MRTYRFHYVKDGITILFSASKEDLLDRMNNIQKTNYMVCLKQWLETCVPGDHFIGAYGTVMVLNKITYQYQKD